MIQIDKETAEKLDRFVELNARSKRLFKEGDHLAAVAIETPEYFQMEKELIEEFLPLIKRLVEAGLLMVSIDITDGDGTPLPDLLRADLEEVYAIADNVSEEDHSIGINASSMYGGVFSEEEKEYSDQLKVVTGDDS
jgi:hypothetical protein